jgi:hypothetical protein
MKAEKLEQEDDTVMGALQDGSLYGVVVMFLIY